MTVYIDMVFLLNLWFDFIILFATNIILKRRVKLRRIILGSVVGSLTVIILFLNIDKIILIIIKIIFCLIICLITYGYKNIYYVIENVIYFYMISFILGGFMYYFKDNNIFSYYFLVILSPIIIYIYIYERKKDYIKDYYYDIKICLLNNKIIALNAFLDTGNLLEDMITHKKIILVSSNIRESFGNKYIYISYNTLKEHGLLKCYFIKYVEINGIRSSNYLVGVTKSRIFKKGVNCILNNYCMEDILCLKE